MARTSGTTARIQRLTSLAATTLVAVAVGFAFGRVYLGHGSTYRLLAVGVASGLVAWLFERRSLVLATVASGAVLLAAIALLVFPETMWHGLPTLTTLRHIGAAASAVGEQARVQVAPTPPIDPLMLAGVTAVWAAVFSCHALAFRAGSPLLALVPPVALVAFADTVLEDFVKPQYGLLFLAAALAVVFADGVRRVQGWGPVWNGPGTSDRLLRSAGRGARRVAVAAVALAAIAPVIVPGFGSKAVFNLSGVNGGSGLRVSPLVALGSALSNDDPVEVFRVKSDQASYWRMAALDHWDGTTWRLADVQGDPDFGPGIQLGPVAAGGRQIAQTFTITNDDLDMPWVPMAYQPESIEGLDVSGHWDADRSTVQLDSTLPADTTYTVTSSYVDPTPKELRDVKFDDPATYGDLVAVPDDLPSVVKEKAGAWTKDKSSTYDKIIAIQNEFSESGDFVYNPDVRFGDSIQALQQFLTDQRQGFCQQFASAMALMLRSLGIPARVAVGFTPQQQPDGTFVETTKQLHAWVEVEFPQYGWLAFEPTPGRTNPTASNYQTAPVKTCHQGHGGCSTGGPDTNGGGVVNGGANNPNGVLGKSVDDPTGTGGDFGPSAVAPATADRRWTLGLVAVGIVLVLGALGLAAVPVGRNLGRRRRLRRAGHEPRGVILATYDVFTDRAGDLGMGRKIGETAEEYRRRVEATGRLSDGHLGRLTGLAVRAAYAPAEPSPDDALDATADAGQTLEDLRRSTPLTKRILGIYRRD
jgi:transglutaminase-like putative cysteine protease